MKSEESVTTQTHEESVVTRCKFVPTSGQANEESTQDYYLARDREMRTIKPPKRYGHADMISYALIFGKEIKDQEEPQSYDKAISSKDNSKWIDAMEEEMAFLEKNQTWTLVDYPKGQSIVGCK